MKRTIITAAAAAIIGAGAFAGCGGSNEPTAAKPATPKVDVDDVVAHVKHKWGGSVKCLELANGSGAKCIVRRGSLGEFALDATYSPDGKFMVTDPLGPA